MSSPFDRYHSMVAGGLADPPRSPSFAIPSFGLLATAGWRYGSATRESIHSSRRRREQERRALVELSASLIPLLLAPVLFRLAGRARRLFAALDGFTLVAIGGLVLLEVLPESLSLAGLWMAPMVILGFAGPTLAERAWTRIGRQVHLLALVLALAGLLLHGFMDGMALKPGTSGAEGALPLAVILHRLPVGLTIWWLLRPKYGVGIAGGVLAGLGLFTIGGFFLADTVITSSSKFWIGMFEALVGGSLLHVVVHSSYPMAQSSSATPLKPGARRAAAGVGALLALLMVQILMRAPHSHVVMDGASPHHHTAEFAESFFELALASAPALLIGYLAAGLVHAFLPKASVAWLRRGSNLGQAMRGVIFGLPIPICSCGVVPVYRSLIQRGAPVGAATALLVAAPELGLDAVLLSIPLLGGPLTVARVLAAAALALLLGWYLGRWSRSHPGTSGIAGEEASEPTGGFLTRLRRGLAIGFGEMVDHTGPWILLGLVVAAVAKPLLDEQWLANIPFGLEVPLFALLGMPLYVCASGATPLVAVLIAAGVSPGAGLAFLLTGPATNVTTFGVLSKLHGKGLAIRFAVGMAILSVALGYGVNWILAASTSPEALHLHSDSPLSWALLFVLGVVFLSSLLRQGPRAFLAEIFSFPSSGDGDEPTDKDAEAADCGHSH